MVTLYKPNLENMKTEVEQTREVEKKKALLRGGLVFGDITEEGPNLMRVLPPTNSRGVLGKKVFKHQYRYAGANIRNLLGHDNDLCVAFTHPDSGITCKICETGSEILADFPQLKLNSWLLPKERDWIQAFDRVDTSYIGAKVYGITPAVYAWLQANVEEAMRSDPPVDPTDLQAGLDLKIDKHVSKTQKGSNSFTSVKYSPSFWTIHGPTPLHKDPAVVEQVIKSMKNLDDYWKIPDDEGLAAIHKAAADLKHYYMSMAASQSVQVPDNIVTGALASVSSPKPQEPPKQVAAEPVQHSFSLETEVTKGTVEGPSGQIVATTQAAASAPSTPPPAMFSQGAEPTPTDRPACFAGKAPREDGGMGYDPDSESCLMCKYELQCMEKCKGAA